MSEERYIVTHVAEPEYRRVYKTFKGAKISICHEARRYRSFGYRAVDTQTNETWRWNPDTWKLEKEKRCVK